MFRRFIPALAIALLIPVAVPLLAPVAVAAPTIVHDTVTSFDNTTIAITVFKPEGASNLSKVPVVLRSHGWAGSRDKTAANESLVKALLDAGYGVVTFDQRGHGDSGGLAQVLHPDFEIKDVSKILDHIATFDWVVLDGPGDPRVGGSGGSYGGGWQLLAAGYDDRLDVLVPEITWNFLPEALGPGGAVKSDWVHVLYFGGKARVDLHPNIDAWYQQAMFTNSFPQAAYDQFVYSSPATHMSSIDKPTLLVQGVPDTLFNLNQAVDNFDGIAANGAPVKLFTHLSGHLLSAGTLAGLAGQSFPSQLDPPFPQPGSQGSPCGDARAEVIAWYDKHLKGLAVDTGENVELAMDDLTCLRGTSLAAIATQGTLVVDDVLAVEGDTLAPLPLASGTKVAGIPTLAFSYVETCTPWTVYASLVAAGPAGLRTVDAQVVPIRSLPSGGCVPGETVTRSQDLGGVGGVVGFGETFALRFQRVNEQFATNNERFPQALVLTDVTAVVPTA